MKQVLQARDAPSLPLGDAVLTQKTPLEHYLKHPLWSSLKSVQNKRVYEVKPDVWATFCPLGVNRILDDLFKYLAK